jgi:hypothetical protein
MHISFVQMQASVSSEFTITVSAMVFYEFFMLAFNMLFNFSLVTKLLRANFACKLFNV